jgi:hypothetical protein
MQNHEAIPRIDSSEAAKRVREYNAGSYRGWSNIKLDREAYNRFRNGLSDDLDDLTDQIVFVGDQYGGAHGEFAEIRAEAALIATNLHLVLGQWREAVGDAKPLDAGVSDERTLDSLFHPFTGTKQWGVWASKTLHFLRPDAFPIFDSNAKKALSLRCGSSSRDYHRFCSYFRDVLLANLDAVRAARRADNMESPTDLKLLDKVLFQIGMHMR